MSKREAYSLQLATGAATGRFKIGERVFHDRALRIREVNEYLMAAGYDAQAALLVEHLNARVADAGEPVDVDWLNDSLAFPDLQALSSLLLYGRVDLPNA